jgi:hypothetical protein
MENEATLLRQDIAELKAKIYELKNLIENTNEGEINNDIELRKKD